MKLSSRPSRISSGLSDSVQHQLKMYTLAASAAGVSLLALAPQAEAKIVYTKTHQVIGYNGIYDIDLNHDGIVDFLVQQIGTTQSTTTLQLSRWLFVKAALGNAIAGNGNYASALKAGAEIGSGGQFINGASNGATMAFVSVFSNFSTHRHRTDGDWANLNNRYLGLKFKIEGKFHYGWARFSVQAGDGKITGTLTGYAYETVANRPIRAGQTEASPVDGQITPEPTTLPTAPRASLGTLAQGARNLPESRQP